MKRPQIVNLELEDLPETHTKTLEYIEKLETVLFNQILMYQVDDQSWDKNESAIKIYNLLIIET